MKSGLLIVTLLVPIFSAFSQIVFEKEISNNVSYPVGIDTADFNGDGFLDLVVFGSWDDKLVWFANNGDGTYGHYNVIKEIPGITGSSIKSFDADGDGDLDILTDYGAHVGWIESLGGGVFGSTINTISGPVGLISSFDFADFDMDGLVDIGGTTNTGGDQLFWVKNLGGGNYAPAVVIATGLTDPYGIISTDLSGDGNPDILIGNAFSGSADQILYYENLGGGAFSSAVLIETFTSWPVDIRVGDIDNDSDIDIGAIVGGSGQFRWYQNTGTGSFAAGVNIFPVVGQIKAFELVDLDVDGDKDVLTGINSGDLMFFENTGSATFLPVQYIAGSLGSFPSDILIADLNNDTNADIAVTTLTSNDISTFQNLGGAVFGPQVPLTDPINSTGSIDAVDLDGDSDLDIIFTDELGDAAFWYENLNLNGFGPKQLIGSTINAPRYIIGADLDGDNDNDVVTASYSDNKIAWFENLGSGVFSSEHVVTTSAAGAMCVQAADIDNDGDLDLLSASFSDNKIAWYENLGSGSFGSQQIIAMTVTLGARSVRAGDLDSDGDLDVVCASENDDEISWFENLGGGSFGSQNVLVTSFWNSAQVEIADLNGDNQLDIIGIGADIGQLVWFQNLGGGTFSADILIYDYGFFYGRSVDVADIDLDGDVDLISVGNPVNTNNGVGNTFLHINNGSGVFSPPQVIDNNFKGAKVQVGMADLDNDGDVDIYSTNESMDKINWFPNQFYNPFQITGNVFFDNDQNGLQDIGDEGLHFVEIISDPQNTFSWTYGDGSFHMNFDQMSIGNFLIFPDSLDYWQITSDSLTYNLLLDGNPFNLDSMDFGLYPDTLVVEIESELTGGFAVCDQIVNYWIDIKNVGTTTPSGVVSLTLDPNITYISSSMVPDSIFGQNIYWHYDSLFYFDNKLITVQVEMPNFTLMNDTLTSTLTAYADTSGLTVFMASDILEQVLVCAYDPNDKIAEPAGLGTPGYIPSDQSEIEYTVRFQNTGTSPSQNVIIKDYFDANLNWATFEPISSSHDVQIDYHPGGQFTFSFYNIMLPDSSSDFVGSQGFIKYKVELLPNLSPGTSIQNTAEIYFDFNPAVVTNTKTHTLYECPGINTLPVQQICAGDSLLIFGQYQTTAGIYTQTLQTVIGCDSILSQQLTLLPALPIQDQGYIDVCAGDSILIYSHYENATGIYYDTLQAINGCDSILSIQLNVLLLPGVSLDIPMQDSVCVNWNGVTLSGNPSGGNYYGNGVSGNEFNPAVAGVGTHHLYYSYEDGSGCIATDSISVFVDGCLGIEDFNSGYISVFPNPFSEYTTVYVVQEPGITYNLVIYDLLGQVVYSRENIGQNQTDIHCGDLKDSFYLLNVKNSDTGKVLYSVTLIVE